MAMKVSELMRELSKHDGDDPVLVRVFPEGETDFRTDRAQSVYRSTRGCVVIASEPTASLPGVTQ